MARKKGKYKKHIGKFLVNSRITVDYTGKKPSVKFGYPSKDDTSTYRTIACSLPAMFIILIAIFFTIGTGLKFHGQPESCNVYENVTIGEFTNTTYFNGFYADCLIDNETYHMTFSFSSGNKILGIYETQPSFVTDRSMVDQLMPAFIALFIIFLFFPICKLFAWIYKNTKWGNKWFPEINKVFGDSKFSATFKECPKNKQIELPLFKNIYLDYLATSEFGRYLERVEIREHPFNELIKKRRTSREIKEERRKRKGKKIKKMIKFKKKKNIWLWKATFFFSKQPKKGQLEIRWT